MSTVILDNKDLKIINLLLGQNFIRIEKIAEELDISDRSVRNYIKRINESLTSIAFVEIERGKGATLVIQSKDKFNELMSSSRNKDILISKEDRVKYIIDYFVELDGIITFDELAYDINIGKTTLINDMKEVEQILSKYHCKIKSKKNIGSYLDYNELDIRMLILNYLCENLSLEEINEKYANISMEKLSSLKLEIYKLLKDNNYKITETVLLDILKYIVVLVYRVGRGYTIDHIEKRHEIIKNFSQYDAYTNGISSIVNRYFNIDTTLMGNLYLSIPFLTRNADVNIDLSNQKIEDSVSELMDKIWKKIYSEVGIVIDDKSMLNNLAVHLSYSLNRMRFNIKVKNTLDYNIRKKYKLAYRLAEISAKVIEEEKKLVVSEDELSFIAIHFGALLENNKAKIEKLKNFALVCENGLGTSMLLKARLNRLLKAETIDVYALYDFKEIDSSKYQVIFTTINLEKDLIESVGLPVIKIDAIFDEDEIKNSLENALYFAETTSINTEGKFLLKFIDDKNIGIYSESEYQVILDSMLDNLLNESVIDLEFKKYIIDREKENPTILDNGIMIPHYTSSLTEEPIISLGVVKDECFHNNRIVKLIILIVYPKNYNKADLILKVYDDIIDLGLNKNLVARIVGATNVLEIKETIRRA